MKKLLTVAWLVASACFVMSEAHADEYVNGYTRSNGTYVAPHYRSSPDSSYNNNWSTRGNTNPYTGQSGTRSPTFNDRAPSYGNSYGGNSGSSYGNSYGNTSRNPYGLGN
jgi:hypothetical protein